MRGQNPLESQVVESLSDPQNQGHPLHETLSQLWEAHHSLLNRIERIARVSDGYQSIVRDREMTDRKSTRLNSSHMSESRMPSSA